MDWLNGQRLGKNMIEKLVKDIWRSVWLDLPEWTKDVKTVISHANAHQKVTSAEEEFNNQVDRMTCSVDSQSLPNGPMS